jgi:hypothetical protein
VPVTVSLNGISGLGKGTTCTLNGGAFTIPSKGNPSGAVSANFTTLPTFTGCAKNSRGEEVKVETRSTKGPSTITAEWGPGQITINPPFEGIWLYTNGAPYAISLAEHNLTGWWANGFSSPILFNTALKWSGTVRAEYGGGQGNMTITPSLQSLTDLTHPSSIPVLGP